MVSFEDYVEDLYAALMKTMEFTRESVFFNDTGMSNEMRRAARAPHEMHLKMGLLGLQREYGDKALDFSYVGKYNSFIRSAYNVRSEEALFSLLRSYAATVWNAARQGGRPFEQAAAAQRRSALVAASAAASVETASDNSSVTASVL